MSIDILTKYEEVEKYLQTVIKNSDANSRCLGFFPPTMYEQLAQKGGLWVVTDSNMYIGHLLFSISWRTYKITINQIHIIPERRKNGFAKRLIDLIKKYGEQNNIIDITAKVASDLKDANRFYENMGFSLIAQEKGGDSTKRFLNIRKCSLHNLLTSVDSRISPKLPAPVSESYTYVLDTNLILDFVEHRRWKETVEKLFRKALGGIISLYVSNETKRELSIKHNQNDDPCVRLLRTLPILKQPPKEFQTTSESILKFIFGNVNPSSSSSKNKAADAKNIQEAIFNGCNGFITRDTYLLKKSTDIFNKYGLEIVSIDEFINTDMVDSNEFSRICFKTPDKTLKLHLDTRYIIQELPNEVQPFHNFLKKRFKNSQIHKLAVWTEKKLLAFALWDNSLRKKEQFDVFLFLDSSEEPNVLLSNILTYIQRFSSKYESKILNLHFLQEDINRFKALLNKYSFYEMNGSGTRVFRKVFFENVVNVHNWAEFVEKLNKLYNTSIPDKLPDYPCLKRNGIQVKEKQRYDFTEFEDNIISPSIIMPKGRPVAIIPIKEDFASDFFNFNATKQLSLELSPKRETFLSDKKVYFREPTSVQNLVNDAIVLFYVSKPYSSIVGFAKIKRLLTVSLKDVETEQKKYGVVDNLEKISKNGLIQCIVFENFVSFDQAIPLKTLKKIGVGKANFVRPESISVEDFNKIYSLTQGFAF